MRGRCVLKIWRDYVTRLLKLVEILSMSNHRACMSTEQQLILSRERASMNTLHYVQAGEF